jgi:hypothetical protein
MCSRRQLSSHISRTNVIIFLFYWVFICGLKLDYELEETKVTRKLKGLKSHVQLGSDSPIHAVAGPSEKANKSSRDQRD